MNTSNPDRVSTVARSIKSPLRIKVPYDPILYGEDVAKDLNQSNSNDFSSVQNEVEVTEDALGSGGDFISVTKSFPFEMLVETKVCGPAYMRKLEREENQALTFEDDLWQQTTVDLMKRRTEKANTRDEVTFITEMKEEVERTLLQDSHKITTSKRNLDHIGPQSKKIDYTTLGLVNDDDYAHLSVREQLSGRLVLIEGIVSKANFRANDEEDTTSNNHTNTLILDPIMLMQKDFALKHYESLFQKLCSERKNASVFSSRHRIKNKRRTLLDTMTREVRKWLPSNKTKKNPITGVMNGTSEDVDLTSILFEAIDVGDIEIVKTSLSEGAIIDLVSPYSYGRTAFQTVFLRVCRMDEGLEMSTSMKKYEELLDILFSHGCDINKTDNEQASNGWAPIHYASINGKLKRIEWLIHRGAIVDIKTKSKQTPLMLACQHGRFEIAYYLIQNQANFRESDCSDQTVLHYASMSGNKSLLDFLVQCGSVNDKLKESLDGETPLSICKRTCQESSEYLQKAVMTKQRMSLYIDKMMKDNKK